MIVVDTSVWVDYLAGRSLGHVDLLARLIEDDEGIAITDVILTEILQGLATDSAVRRVRSKQVTERADTSARAMVVDIGIQPGRYRPGCRKGSFAEAGFNAGAFCPAPEAARPCR